MLIAAAKCFLPYNIHLSRSFQTRGHQEIARRDMIVCRTRHRSGWGGAGGAGGAGGCRVRTCKKITLGALGVNYDLAESSKNGLGLIPLQVPGYRNWPVDLFIATDIFVMCFFSSLSLRKCSCILYVVWAFTGAYTLHDPTPQGTPGPP